MDGFYEKHVFQNRFIKIIGIIILILLFTLPRLYLINSSDFANDEVAFFGVTLSKNMFEYYIYSYDRVNTAPLGHILGKILIFFLPLKGLRLFSFFTAIFGFVGFFLICRTFFKKNVVIWITMALFCVNPLLIRISRMFRPYSLFISIFILSQYFFIKWIESGPKYAKYYVLFSSMLIPTHYFGASIVITNAFQGFLLKKNRFLEKLITFSVVFLSFFPLLYFLSSNFPELLILKSKLNWLPKPNLLFFISSVANLLFDQTTTLTLILSIGLLSLSLGLCFYKNRKVFWFVATLIVIPKIFIIVSYLLFDISLANIHYLSFLSPILLIIIPKGLVKYKQWSIVPFICIVSLVAFLNLFSLKFIFYQDNSFTLIESQVISKHNDANIIVYPPYYSYVVVFHALPRLLSNMEYRESRCVFNKLLSPEMLILQESYNNLLNSFFKKPPLLFYSKEEIFKLIDSYNKTILIFRNVPTKPDELHSISEILEGYPHKYNNKTEKWGFVETMIIEKHNN